MSLRTTSSIHFIVVLILLLTLLLTAGCNSEPDLTIPVVMRKFAIEPAEIRVKKGQRVRLKVSTADVQHGFHVPDKNIREPVQPGRPAVVVFTAERRGEYRVVCSILCGKGHDDMKAVIIVE